MKKGLFHPFYAAAGLVAAVAALSGLLLFADPQGRVEAATPNLAPGYDVEVIPIHISGQYTATTADVAQFKLPFSGSLIGVSATARASGGTSPTLTVDVQDDGTTVLSSAISITAGTVSEGTVNAAAIADESEITIDLTIGGGTPTWNDITVLLTIVRT